MIRSICEKLIYMITVIMVLQSCEREFEYPLEDETTVLKQWYEEQGKPHALEWSKIKSIESSDNVTTLIVPLESGINIGPDNALSKNIVFTIDAQDKITGFRLDLFSNIATITDHAEEMISNFFKKKGHNDPRLGKVYFMTYDINDEFLFSQLMDKDNFKAANIRVTSQSVDVKTKMKRAQEKKKSTNGPSIANIPVVCKEWYLVQHFDDGSEEWYYLYTVCSSTGNDTGGESGGVGGSGGASSAYFYESPADPIDIQKLVDCFINVPSNSETKYKVTIHTHLANPNLVTQVYNFTEDDPGHSYITMEKTNGSTSRSLTFGFYPLTDTWITGTKNAVGSSIGMEDSDDRRSDASYTISISEAAFNNMKRIAVAKSSKPYDLNDYNCTDYAIDVFNGALATENQLVVSDSPIGFTTPAGLYARLNQMKSSGITGISMTGTKAPISTAPCK